MTERGNIRPDIDDERLRPMKHGDDGVYRAPVGGAGDVVIRADLAGTAVFVVTAFVAAWRFTSTWQWIGAITALVLFAVGVFTFLWSYYNAVQRSRTEELSVMQLYLLIGPPTPAPVRRTMLTLLAVQVGVGIGTALARANGADGSPGTSLALGVLVPMFGLGLNGLWAAYHAAFPPRAMKNQSGDPGVTE
ncbi:MAG: hypothetical protein ACK5OX_18090 [Desertimonas sp.]